jgi:cyclopropane fatty-acyl-phospholipid synthase-like methyltransferase
MSVPVHTIAAMPLYATIGRIRNELRELGTSHALTPEQLYPFDQIHYRGIDAVRDAALALGLGPSHRVLDVGAGIGGPARFLAHTTGCQVDALELQPEMHALGEELTARCGLDGRVRHVQGDALTHSLDDGAYDAAVSWLAVHHIPERPRLLRRIGVALRPGGRLFIDDLCERAPFTADDLPDVQRTLHGVTMTSPEDYATDIRAAGFADVQVTDMSDDWATFCAGRAAAWRTATGRHTRVHGEQIVETLDTFFTTVARMFASGRLGGVRILASRRATE